MNMMVSEKLGNHLYIFHNGVPIYKRWLRKDGVSKAQPSLLFQTNGWPNEWIV
jgi:hypothetical protein